MPLFSLLFTGVLLILLLVVLAVFAFLWLASLIAFLVGWRMKWPVLKWLGGVPLAGLTLVAVLAGAGIVYAVVTEPRHAYERAFQAPPSADVVDLESNSGGFADSNYAYLRFHADRATFDRIRPKDMQPLDADRQQAQFPGDYPYSPPPPPAAEFYSLDTGDGRRGFASESFWMAYDPATKTVYYAYQGID